MTAVKKNQVIVLKRPGESSERVHLEAELKSGGAGFVYSIKDDSGRVIKIYRPETLLSEGATYQKKIECMLGNVPNVSEIPSGDRAIVQLAWPLASAYTIHDEFVGFAMPMIDMRSTTELEYVLSHKQAEKEGLPHHLGVGVALAHNLAAVVSSVHALGHAIVDLKPVNLKFYKKELYVAVLDCDGFYINVPGKTTSAPQVTVDYLAPEFQNSPITRPEHQDMFALAVIIFKLLNFGIHPYAGVPVNGAKIPSDLEEKIKACLYPYGVVPHKKISPVPASTHETFPTELRALFDRAFGGIPSDRPKATEWAGTLKKYAEKSKGLLDHCTHQHLHFKDMDCATCLREQTIDQAKTAAAARSAILPSLSKNTSRPSIQSGSMNTSFPGNTPLSRPSWIQPKSLAQQTQSQATAPSGLAQTASQSSVQQSLTSPSSFKFVEFVWGTLKKFLPTIAILAAALLATPVGWGLLGISLVAGYFIGIKFWITSIALVFLFYKSAEDEFGDEWARVLVSLAAGVLFTGLIFAGISIYGYFNPGNETANIEGRKNVKAVESRQVIADIPAPISPQKTDTKQESPQDTAPHPVTWSDTWPKTAPVAQESPPIAVQESTSHSNSDRIPVAGSTVGQVNENASGTRGWLGVDAQPLTSELASSMNPGSAPRGMLINDVVKGGPADKAGIVAGDLLVAVDNKAVDTSDAIQDVVSNITTGRTVPIKIIRNGSDKYLLLTITQRP